MLNYNQALPEQTLLQDLQMKELKPIMKLIVRGKKREFISAIGKSLNILLPSEANRTICHFSYSNFRNIYFSSNSI